jgi:uncharacterized protein YuzE
MRMRYDIKHDILYIDIAPNKEVHGTQPLDDDVFMDFDEGETSWNVVA